MWNQDVYFIFKKYVNLYFVMIFNYVDFGNYYEVIKYFFYINMMMWFLIFYLNYMFVMCDLLKDKCDMILKWLDCFCFGDVK